MNRLRELREDRDLLQKDVAEAIGLSQRNYSYYETEQAMLTTDILRNLANFYNTSIDYILYETDERKPYPKSIMKKMDNAVDKALDKASKKI